MCAESGDQTQSLAGLFHFSNAGFDAPENCVARPSLAITCSVMSSVTGSVTGAR